MNDKLQQNNIVQEISVLYELSLSVGQSLNLSENCDIFLKALIARKNLEFASVWINNEYLGKNKTEGYSLVYSNPKFKANKKKLGQNNPISTLLKVREAEIVRSSDSLFENIITEKTINNGSYAIFKLGKIGFLKLYSSIREEVLSEKEFHQLKKVIEKFAISLEGCLTHLDALRGFAERKQIERQVENLSKFPEENPFPVLKISDRGKLLYSNSASKQVLRRMDIVPGDTLPDEFIDVVNHILETGESGEVELNCGSIIYSLNFVPIAKASYINIYGSDITTRKQAETELSKLKLFYEQTLDDLPGQIAVFDTDLRYLYLNKMSVADDDLRLWLIGKNDFEYCKYRGYDLAIAENRQKRLKKVIESRSVISFEEDFINNEGTHKYFLRFITPILSVDGQLSNLLAYGIDITERKKVEMSLNESSARIEAIVNNAVEAIITINQNGIIDSFNPQAEKIFGYSSSEIIGKKVNLLMPHPHNEEHDGYINKYLATGKKNIIGIGREVIGVRKDGKQIPIELSVGEVRINEKILFTGIIRDITERKKTEAALIRNEQNQRIINYFATSLTGSNSVDEILWDITYNCISKMGFEDCIIYLFNEDRTKLIQSAAYGANKENNYQILNPIEIPIGEGIVGSVARNGKSELIDDVTKDARYIIDDKVRGSEITIPILYENEVIGIIDSEHSQKYFYEDYHLQILESIASLAANKIMRTISLQKTHESEKKLSAVLSTVGEGIITINENSVIVMANEEVEKIWGYSRDELIGSYLQNLMPPQFRENHHAGMKRYLETRVPKVLGKKLELEGLKKNGSIFPIELTIMETIIEDKLFFTAAVHDISERKILIQKLKQSNAALSEFAYIASHDLREPLRKISSFGSILEQTLAEKMDEDDRENLNFMIDGAKRMQQMIDDLLSYSRLTSQVITFEEINLDELFSELINFELAALIEETQAKIISNAPLGIVKGEPTQVKQLFQNLINNAIKYRKLDALPVINLRSQKQQKMIKIEIKDNGIGIDPVYQTKIFEMFKRLHNRTQYPGSGIGLSICKKIVDIHEGEIGVESEVNSGANFWVTLLNAEVNTIEAK